jgi:uncharacterized protein YaaQ
MKMVMAIIGKQDTDAVLDTLLEAGYRTTRLASTGGFLREGNTTLLIGVEDPQVDPLIALLRQTMAARPAGPPNRGRGAVFILPLENFVRF